MFWLPFYYVFKAAGILWLALPQTKGAVFVYSRILRPFLIAKEQEIDGAASRATKAASDALKQQLTRSRFLFQLVFIMLIHKSSPLFVFHADSSIIIPPCFPSGKRLENGD